MKNHKPPNPPDVCIFGSGTIVAKSNGASDSIQQPFWLWHARLVATFHQTQQSNSRTTYTRLKARGRCKKPLVNPRLLRYSSDFPAPPADIHRINPRFARHLSAADGPLSPLRGACPPPEPNRKPFMRLTSIALTPLKRTIVSAIPGSLEGCRSRYSRSDPG